MVVCESVHQKYHVEDGVTSFLCNWRKDWTVTVANAQVFSIWKRAHLVGL